MSSINDDLKLLEKFKDKTPDNLYLYRQDTIIRIPPSHIKIEFNLMDNSYDVSAQLEEINRKIDKFMNTTNQTYAESDIYKHEITIQLKKINNIVDNFIIKYDPTNKFIKYYKYNGDDKSMCDKINKIFIETIIKGLNHNIDNDEDKSKKKFFIQPLSILKIYEELIIDEGISTTSYDECYNCIIKLINCYIDNLIIFGFEKNNYIYEKLNTIEKYIMPTVPIKYGEKKIIKDILLNNTPFIYCPNDIIDIYDPKNYKIRTFYDKNRNNIYRIYFCLIHKIVLIKSKLVIEKKPDEKKKPDEGRITQLIEKFKNPFFDKIKEEIESHKMFDFKPKKINIGHTINPMEKDVEIILFNHNFITSRDKIPMTLFNYHQSDEYKKGYYIGFFSSVNENQFSVFSSANTTPYAHRNILFFKPPMPYYYHINSPSDSLSAEYNHEFNRNHKDLLLKVEAQMTKKTTIEFYDTKLEQTTVEYTNAPGGHPNEYVLIANSMIPVFILKINSKNIKTRFMITQIIMELLNENIKTKLNDDIIINDINLQLKNLIANEIKINYINNDTITTTNIISNSHNMNELKSYIDGILIELSKISQPSQQSQPPQPNKKRPFGEVSGNDDTSSKKIQPIDYYEKYLKYKNKYLQLKNNLSNMKLE